MSVGALSPSAEAAWETVRQHAEWSPGFWLGWIFTAHAPSAHALCGRLERSLADAGRSSRWWLASTPDELAQIQRWLLEGAEGTDGCAWVAVAEQTPAWRAAWEQLMSRLNERRELLRERMKGGLVFVAPPALKAATRESAPDLWSIRSWALDVEGLADYFFMFGVRVPPVMQREGDPAVELALAREAVSAAEGSSDGELLATALLRVSKALSATGDLTGARDVATRAFDVATSKTSRAIGACVLANMLANEGNTVAAEMALCLALEILGGWLHEEALELLIRLLRARGATDRATEILQGLLNLPQVQSTSWILLRARAYRLLGEILSESGRWQEVLACYSAAEFLLEGLAPEDPQDARERLLAILWSKTGRAMAALNLARVSDALAIYEELQAILSSAQDERPDRQIHLFRSHILLGLAVCRAQLGQRARALEPLRECRSILMGSTPQGNPWTSNDWRLFAAALLQPTTLLADLTPDPEEAAALRAEVAKLQASLTPESP